MDNYMLNKMDAVTRYCELFKLNFVMIFIKSDEIFNSQ